MCSGLRYHKSSGRRGIPEITMGFCKLIGGMRLPSFQSDLTELQEWILSIQKKQVIYGLSDQEMVLLAYKAAAGPVSKYVAILVRQGNSEAMEDLGERIAGLAALAFPKLVTRNSGPIQALLADVYME